MFMIRIVIVRHKRPRCLAVVQSPTHENTAPPTPKNTFCKKKQTYLFERNYDEKYNLKESKYYLSKF